MSEIFVVGISLILPYDANETGRHHVIMSFTHHDVFLAPEPGLPTRVGY